MCFVGSTISIRCHQFKDHNQVGQQIREQVTEDDEKEMNRLVQGEE